MKLDIPVWDRPDILESFESERERRHISTPRLTYDCFNAKCKGTDDKVRCSKGHTLYALSPDGSLSVNSVLRGRTAKICKTCEDFNG